MPLDGAVLKGEINYLLFRQKVERSRAETAGSIAARRVHRELAELYQKRIERLTEGCTRFPPLQNRAAE